MPVTPVKRNTVAYFKEQVSEITAVLPTSTTDGFLSIEPPDVTTGEYEQLPSDLLSSSIGMRKPQLGFETASCSVVTELRSHGDIATPTQPDFGILVESCIGTPNTSVADTVQALPAPSTTEVTIGTEGNIKQHDLVLIDNTTDGKVGRFVKSLKLAVIAGINDKIDFNEGGAELNATLTAGVYTHGSSSVVGSIGEEIKTQMEAVVGQTGTITVTAIPQADGSYKYTIANSTPSFALLIATGANTADAFLKLNLGFGAVDLTGATSYTGVTAIWGNRLVFNVAMTTAPTTADDLYASVNYKPISSGHKHFTSGFYHGDTTDGFLEQVIGCLVNSLGMEITTGQIAKLNFDIAGLKGNRVASTEAPYDPSYENVQGLVAFCVDFFLGSTQMDSNTFSLSCENDVIEKQSFKECSGKIGSIVRQRNVTGSMNPYADSTITYYEALRDQTDFDIMVIIGKKDADGFMPGQTVGIYLPQVMLTQVKTGDIDDNIIHEINFQAHTGVNGTLRDIVLSFV